MSEQALENTHPSNGHLIMARDQLFLNAALGSNQWWRWVAGVVVILLMWIGVGAVGLVVGGCAFLGATNVFGLDCSSADGLTGNGSVIAELVLAGLGFAVGLIGIWLVVKFIHKKQLIRIVTGRKSFDFSRYLHGLVVALFLPLLLFLFNRYVLQLEMTYHAPGWEFLLFVLVAIVLVPIHPALKKFSSVGTFCKASCSWSGTKSYSPWHQA